MSDKEKIRQEIEKRLSSLWDLIPEGEKVLKDDFTKEDANNLGRYTELESLLQFIDSLPAEPASKDLEEEISKWRNHYISVLDNNLRIDLRDIEVTANHFAEWQKQRDKLTWVDMNQITACYEITREKFGTGNYTDKEWGEDILKQYKEAKEE